MKEPERMQQKSPIYQTDSYIINKDSPYYLEKSYFEKIMVDLGLYIAQRYKVGHDVQVDDLLSKIAYISDLTIHQKMSFALFFGKHLENHMYEEYILAVMNQDT